MNYKAQYIGIWFGAVGLVLLVMGQWILMGYLPPLDPLISATDLGAYFRDNQTKILVGAMCLQYGAVCFIPFSIAVAQLIARIENPSRFWTHLLVAGCVLGYFPIFVSYALWSAAAYRPERADELIQLLNDSSMFMYVGAAAQGPLMFCAVGFAVLADRSAKPLLPRWLGYVSLWTALLSLPNTFISLFKAGPFAWNGLVDFWIPAVVFGNWIALLFWCALKAYKRLMQEQAV